MTIQDTFANHFTEQDSLDRRCFRQILRPLVLPLQTFKLSNQADGANILCLTMERSLGQHAPGQVHLQSQSQSSIGINLMMHPEGSLQTRQMHPCTGLAAFAADCLEATGVSYRFMTYRGLSRGQQQLFG